ncbi:MAG: nicotinate-nucleotide adenylyltransferase [Maricaulaceae bacterium]
MKPLPYRSDDQSSLTPRKGRAIGLFGGSFNPAHAGHLHVATTALERLGLHEVWWMVSPQNPLKPTQPSYDSRVQTVMDLGLPPHMKIAHLERDYGTQYTVDLIRRARTHMPDTRFVFLMGADNFSQLPRWKGWREIIETVPIAIIARPTKSGTPHFRARLGAASQIYHSARIKEEAAAILSWQSAPAWTYITSPLNRLSSTQIRAAQKLGNAEKS